MKKLQEMMSKKKELIDENAVSPTGFAENLIDQNNASFEQAFDAYKQQMPYTPATIKSLSQYNKEGELSDGYSIPYMRAKGPWSLEGNPAAMVQNEDRRQRDEIDRIAANAQKNPYKLKQGMSQNPSTPNIPDKGIVAEIPSENELMMEKLKQILMGK